MKPANEIEIKRNVYTFSAIVLVLSVLIGSSAWTLIGKGAGDCQKRLVDLQGKNTRLSSEVNEKEGFARDLKRDTTKMGKLIRSLDELKRTSAGKYAMEINDIHSALNGLTNASTPFAVKIVANDVASCLTDSTPSKASTDLSSRLRLQLEGIAGLWEKSSNVSTAPTLGGGKTTEQTCKTFIDVAVSAAKDRAQEECNTQKDQLRDLSMNNVKDKMDRGLKLLRKGSNPLKGTTSISEIPTTATEWANGGKSRQVVIAFKELCLCIESGKCE